MEGPNIDPVRTRTLIHMLPCRSSGVTGDERRTITDKTTGTAEPEVDRQNRRVFRGLFRSTRIGRNGDSTH